MVCVACATTIADDSTEKVEADPKTKLVKIETQQSEAVVKEAIATAGYTVTD